METFIYAIGATLIVSVVSFIGVLGLFLKEKSLDKILLLLVGLSAGSLLGGAFLHLLPEAVEESGAEEITLYALLGFVFFFLIERFLHWHHHHHCEECERKTLPIMNLVGDGLHNFIDGLIIAVAFMVDTNVGVITTIAIICHELPQEISDFGVLVYGGFSKGKALIWNFISALFAVVGAIVGLLLSHQIEGITHLLLAITAGGFIYIAASDLIPEINNHHKFSKAMWSFVVFLLGIVMMYLVKYIFEG